MASRCLKVLIAAVAVLSVVLSSAGAAGEAKVRIAVDPRIELLAVVQHLSGYRKRLNLLNDYDFPYRKNVDAYFAPYRDHRAVRLFAEMSAADFTFDAPPGMVLHLSDPPELAEAVTVDEYYARRAGGRRRLEEFLSALRDFAAETDFASFWKANLGGHEETAERIRRQLAGVDYVGTLEEYCGGGKHTYTVVLAPLFRGNYGPRIKRDDGTLDIYSVSAPRGVEDGYPVFGSVEDFRHLLWHEFGHSFVNPLYEKHAAEVDKYESLFEPISERMKKQAYGTWGTTVSEHIVRAIGVRLAERELGAGAAALSLAYEKGMSFIYVPALCERLKEYEAARNKYPTLESFYPRLVDAFRELSEGETVVEVAAPSFSNINSVVLDKKNVVIIIPTSESDKNVQARIHAFISAIHERFFAGRPVLTDSEALKRDLSANSLIVYGTPEGNLWLAKHISKMPVRIEADRIVAGKEHAGRSLRFITVWRNPDNPEKGVVVYTAQQAVDIIEINAVFHGPTEYLVAKGEKVLEAADYDRQADGWKFK